ITEGEFAGWETYEVSGATFDSTVGPLSRRLHALRLPRRAEAHEFRRTDARRLPDDLRRHRHVPDRLSGDGRRLGRDGAAGFDLYRRRLCRRTDRGDG